MSWADIYKFIFDYQALIAGLVAIGAAYITARPVWRQLNSMSVQTNSLLRDYAIEQLRRGANRRKWYADRLKNFNEDVARRIYEMEELEGGGVNVHWAAETQQRADMLLVEIIKHGETRDLSSVDSELSALKACLSKIIDTLDSIHRPASMDQHDEDHSFTDEEWAAIQVDADKAEGELSAVAANLSKAALSLDEAFAEELVLFQQQLKQVQGELNSQSGRHR